MNPHELVQIGIQRGWIKLPVAQETAGVAEAYSKDRQKYKRDWYRLRRARFHEQGLNSMGKPYKNKKHPDLNGLSRRDYHAEYMRQQREGLV